MQQTTLFERMKVVIYLSIPGILAQISEIAMQYIDASMVGSLGKYASASIGLVTTSTWLVGGLIQGTSAGFYVQVAHAVGSRKYERARRIMKYGYRAAFAISIVLAIITVAISGYLPIWLNGAQEIRYDAMMYFRIFALFIPVRMLYFLSAGALQCTGDMKTPSLLSAIMAVCDVIFNALLIFDTRVVEIFHFRFTIYGASLGVTGAALGTALSFVVALIGILYAVLKKSEILHKRKEVLEFRPIIYKEALRIGFPMALEQSAMSFAQVISTSIVAPLGTEAIAANSFAVTAEAICYMPGFGIQSAATALVGQTVGAKRKDLAKSFAWLTTFMGMFVMSVNGFLMYFLCPYVLMFLTPVASIQMLAVSVLRIELWAEPLFAAAIVGVGVLRGAGDTLVPACLNLVSIWGVRITLASILSKSLGLHGVWIAMACELSFRGIVFLLRLKQGKWLQRIPLAS